tara:strand:- start:10322 stop:11059 length:738 start_codon:yes stop_codon:yes gene_type:complete
MNKAVIITGSNGGIGAALKAKFSEEGYSVIGVGKSADTQNCDEYIQVDFAELAESESAQNMFAKKLLGFLANYSLKGLINNSAVQILASMGDLSVKDFQTTLNVNLVVPFILSKICLESLTVGKGSILNIGSIHAKLTKKQFVAYATSKGALEAMTRAMAVDVGSVVRVNLISPAAIETEMLLAGFEGSKEKYKVLGDHHPAGRIGSVEEVATLCFRLVSDDYSFLNGSVIEIGGGIHGRLHDPI